MLYNIVLRDKIRREKNLQKKYIFFHRLQSSNKICLFLAQKTFHKYPNKNRINKKTNYRNI